MFSESPYLIEGTIKNGRNELNKCYMRKTALILGILLCVFFFQFSVAQTVKKKPKVIIGMMVDQMRWDYLYKYSDRYKDGGFKRLLKEGFTCENTQINYAPTITACGHASVYTGSVPAINGIAGNSWPIIDQGIDMNCVGDESVLPVGSNSSRGKASPRNLLTTTIGDELKIATNFRSKVVGVSIKDRAAILPAGHAADGAFWFDSSSGNFISSTWYMQKLPAWVQEFNNKKLPTTLIQNNWNTLYPIETYRQSTPDDQEYENKLGNEERPVFPHLLIDEKSKENVSISNTPFGNTLVLEFAKAVLEGYKMGKGEETDLLAISLSSTDAVGHRFGPNSIEIEDTYLRLDNELAGFFKYLDERFGKDGYLFFITADHAVSHSPGFLIENKLPGGGVDGEAIIKTINQTVKNEFGIENVILTSANSQLYLNHNEISKNKVSQEEIEVRIIELMKKVEGIADAIPSRKLGSAVLSEPIKSMLINGHHAKRSGDIVLLLESGWKTGSLSGASHSAWNPYDAHIPLVWMGWGVTSGKTNRTINITDIAPTLAALLNIQMPSGNIGHVISEITN